MASGRAPMVSQWAPLCVPQGEVQALCSRAVPCAQPLLARRQSTPFPSTLASCLPTKSQWREQLLTFLTVVSVWFQAHPCGPSRIVPCVAGEASPCSVKEAAMSGQ